MTPATILPIPRTPEEVAAWFAALELADLRNGLLGLASLAAVGLAVVILAMVLRKAAG